MLKRLLQSLGLVQKPQRQRRPSGHHTGGGGQKRCRNCSAVLSPSAFRCPACGARVLQDQSDTAREASAPARGKRPPAELGELERRILLSASADRATRIATMQATSSAPGEVKAGADRYEGDAALAAVDALLRLGYIVEWGDGSYAVTPEGMTQAGKID
jgi:RNA polymerase subunit RPABC4/transcription elongation factor Spt4